MDKLPTFTPIMSNLNKQTMTVTIGMDKRSMSTILERTNEYKALPEKLRPGIEKIGDYVKDTMIPYTFEKEGPGWKRLAKRTQRERNLQGYGAQHPILIRSKDLYRELVDRSHPKHIEIIKVGKKARIEIGGSSQKFLENQLGKPAQKLPARPMVPGTGNIPILERDKQEMVRILERAYQQYINRPR